MLRTTDDLWSRVRSDPSFAPELLAESTVLTYGPRARAWADRMRAAYPLATPDAVARLATAEHVRLAAAAGGAAALAGLLAPVAGGAALAGLQLRLVLRIAAAYGMDPTAPERAVDLLVLTRVHPDPDTARQALSAAGKPGHHRPARRGGVPLVRTLTRWAKRKALTRVVPGAAVALGAVAGADAVKVLAARAVQFYRARIGGTG